MNTSQTASFKESIFALKDPYVSAALIIAFIGGLLLPKAAWVGLDRGLIVWLVICIATGVILSNLRQRKFKMSMLASFTFILALIGYYLVRWLISRIINIEAASIEIPFGSGESVDLLDPTGFPYLFILLALFWIGTTITVITTASSGRLLIEAALKLYAFGPEGLERVRKIILALAGIISAILVLWAAFG